MRCRTTERYVEVSTAGERVRAFVPDPLPPEPAIDAELRESLDRGLIALGRLSASAAFLPDAKFLLYLYVRKEAVLSSQIEGTQSSLTDLLLFEIEEAPGVPVADVGEVSRYVAALVHGLSRMRSGFPLSNRLIREMHAILLSEGRGSTQQPGEFRTSQNWIGGSRPGNAIHVPPPADLVPQCMADLEEFLHDRPKRTPALLKAALAHVQFETIHPFSDGNGRLGRLLVTLILCSEDMLKEPVLYLSLYFKNHRQEYYDLLQRVRIEGDWEAWTGFFARAVRETAEQCTTTVERVNKFAQEDRKAVQRLGRIAGSASMVHQELISRPLTTVAQISASTGLVPNTVAKVFAALTDEGIVREITGRRRNRLFTYGPPARDHE